MSLTLFIIKYIITKDEVNSLMDTVIAKNVFEVKVFSNLLFFTRND